MTRLAQFIHRLHSAAVALRDENSTLESLRLINRELIVLALAEVPEAVAEKCDLARGHVLKAIRLLDPTGPPPFCGALPTGTAPNVEELPPAEHNALLERNARKFEPLTDPPGLN